MALPPDRLAQQELYARLSATDLLRSRIETERLETIPLGRVLTEHALVDPSHANELGASMQQKRGQLTPITVRARLEEKSGVVYDVIDGFHRTEGKKRTGEADINATVVYGCTDEEMFDLRILAASSVRTVQFARVAQWINMSYANTVWAKKGLSVNTAFRIAYGGYGSTANREVSDQEVGEMKEWLQAKCDKWGRPLGTIRNELMLVSQSDPTLVKEVRNVTTAQEAQTVITQRKLAAVVKQFPKESNFPIQRAILHYAVENKLNPGQIEGIVILLKGVIDPRLTEGKLREAVEKAHGALPKLPEVTSARRGRKSVSRSLADGRVVDDLSDDLVNIGAEDFDLDEMLAIEEALADGELSDETREIASKRKYVRSQPKAVRKGAFGQGDLSDADALRQRIVDLESAIGAATAKNNSSSETWWRTAPYLTPTERICVERGLYGHEDMSALSTEIHLPVLQIFTYMRSAFAKRHILQKGEKL